MDIAGRFPQLPESVLRHMIEDMCSILPPPEPDTPENRERFRQAAIDEFIALDPFDIFDAMAAKSIVISEAMAWDCLRNAKKPGTEFRLAGRWESLARNHLRLAQSMRRDIERRRKKRMKETEKQAKRKPVVPKREEWPIAITPTGVLLGDPPPLSDLKRQELRPRTSKEKLDRIRQLRLHLVEAPATRH